ncbi:FAD-binding oxidoreductase [Chitinivorax sp. PXF-14]|uniref:FAD-binding oxidoreductase n=1 Tax=Chitinivorax sp. PXF-14 TaxID=3230488 RepID=UPI003465B213
MPDTTLLNAVAGYAEAMADKHQLEQHGSDFSELRHAVGATLAQLHPTRIALTIADIIDETPSTRTLRLVPLAGELPPFQAGQYVNLYVDIDGVQTARPYAISSSPSVRSHYDLTIKRARDGYVSHYLLDRVAVGQRLESSGPMGTFFHNPLFHGSELVFLAGGSGIVPARSMILDMLDRHLPWRFQVIYGNSYADDVIFQQELRELAAAHDNFTLTEIVSRPADGYTGLAGHLSAELIERLVGDVAGRMYYICGPTPFNDNCLAQLAQLGVKRRRIRVEANGAPKCPASLAQWPAHVRQDHEVTVTVHGKGSFRARAGEPLLNSLERNGYAAENACRSGECSLCRVKLLSGEVFNPPEAKLRQSDRDFGWVHTCVAFPTQDIEILL